MNYPLLLLLLITVIGAGLTYRSMRLQRSLHIIDTLEFESRKNDSWQSEQNWAAASASPHRAKSLAPTLALLTATSGSTFVLVGLFGLSIQRAIVTLLAVGSISYLLYRRHLRQKEVRLRRQISAVLPSVVERIVMGVHAGLDVIPAIERVVALGVKESATLGVALDPVTTMLQSVMSRYYVGVSLEDSLEECVRKSDSIALRHAFVHLAIAHREGGELVAPLRELGDATQLFYQETIEEEINKLPVKATLPLVLTFAGLILCFLVTPIVQVLTITQRPGLESAK